MPANNRINIALIVALALLAGCAGSTPPAACRGDAFSLNAEAPR